MIEKSLTIPGARSIVAFREMPEGLFRLVESQINYHPEDDNPHRMLETPAPWEAPATASEAERAGARAHLAEWESMMRPAALEVMAEWLRRLGKQVKTKDTLATAKERLAHYAPLLGDFPLACFTERNLAEAPFDFFPSMPEVREYLKGCEKAAADLVYRLGVIAGLSDAPPPKDVPTPETVEAWEKAKHDDWLWLHSEREDGTVILAAPSHFLRDESEKNLEALRKATGFGKIEFIVLPRYNTQDQGGGRDNNESFSAFPA